MLFKPNTAPGRKFRSEVSRIFAEMDPNLHGLCIFNLWMLFLYRTFFEQGIDKYGVEDVGDQIVYPGRLGTIRDGLECQGHCKRWHR